MLRPYSEYRYQASNVSQHYLIQTPLGCDFSDPYSIGQPNPTTLLRPITLLDQPACEHGHADGDREAEHDEYKVCSPMSLIPLTELHSPMPEFHPQGNLATSRTGDAVKSFDVQGDVDELV